MKFKFSKAYTITELLIALGIGSIISLAIAIMLTSTDKSINEGRFENSLISKASEIKQFLQNQSNFTATISSALNPDLNCISATVSCGSSASCLATTQCGSQFVHSTFSSTYDRIKLVKPSGGIYMNGQSDNTNGFTERGDSCTGFAYTGNGNDSCPVGYLINWYILSAGTSKGNSLVITAKMVYNPSDSNRLKKRINAPVNDVLSKYDVSYSYNLESIINGSSATCFQNGLTISDNSSYNFFTVDSVPTGNYCPSPEVRQCTSKDGVTTLTGSAPFPSCVQNCSGAWSYCSTNCGPGTQIYSLNVPGNQWGDKSCPAHGSTQACNYGACPFANCVGAFSSCSVSCGAGIQTYHITTAKQGSGADCPFAEGSPQGCYPPAAVCTANIDCAGDWGACSTSCGPGTRTFTVTQAQAGTGAACAFANGATQACNLGTCPVNCVGSWGAWGACSAACGPGYQTRTYSITTSPSNGGAACSNVNGETQSQACTNAACAVATAGTCGSANGTYDTAQPILNLCSTGTPSAVTWTQPNGYWGWTCSGTISTETCKTFSKNKWDACFIAGTQVTLKNGSTKNIEDIQKGEEVLTFDEVSKGYVSRPVNEVQHHAQKISSLYTFYYQDKKVTSNDIHMIYLARENKYESAADIFKKWQNGQEIYFLNSDHREVLVTDIQTEQKATELFNIHVQGLYDQNLSIHPNTSQNANHNYFANDILVHNVKKCGGVSGPGNYTAICATCNTGVGYCDCASNVLFCNFKTPADLTTFQGCFTAAAVCP